MGKNIKACLSHNTDDWKTPKLIYEAFINAGYIDCFKYKSKENEFTKGLYINKKLFVNPPFSKMKEVALWVRCQDRARNKIALLIPARTDTKYFEELIRSNPKIYFIKGRLHYNESKSAPFPTILMVFNQEEDKKYQHITQEGLLHLIEIDKL